MKNVSISLHACTVLLHMYSFDIELEAKKSFKSETMSLGQSELFSKSILDKEKCSALNASIVVWV